MKKSVSERELVLGILLEVTEKGAYSHLVLREVLQKYQYLDKKERAFITRVTEGTLEHLLELDYILDQFSHVKVQKMKPVIRDILRSAVYQLKYMDTVPDSAVCNEAVKLAVKKGFGSLRGFVNGVLRSTARKLEQVKYPEDPLERLSVQYSMPMWILKQWLSDYDRQTVERMLDAFYQEKPLMIRRKLSQGGDKCPEKFRKMLEREGVQITPHPYLSYAFYIAGYDFLGELESFQKGEFMIQDVSSMLVCEVAGGKEGDLVFDVCAAPGGKALHMAEKLNGTGRVEARDLTASKVGLIQENIERMGLTNIQAIQQDARILDEDSVKRADIVLADLPCSGLGVLGKKTDLKYRITREEILELKELQQEILSTVQNYVKPGGTLVYSTCTIHPAENMDNVHWFLEKYPEYTLKDIRGSLCAKLAADVQEGGCLQLLPGVHQSDGFFLAALQRA